MELSPGDVLARIAEGQIGTRADLAGGRAALYGYLLATDSPLRAFEPTWSRSEYGASSTQRLGLLGRAPEEGLFASRLRLPGLVGAAPEPGLILRIHSWCAAFVDWCVLQLLLVASPATALTLSQRPKVARAFDLLDWAGKNGCIVVEGNETAPIRGDIAVFSFSHTGIVSQPGTGHFASVEGNTTLAAGGNQGYIVAKRRRGQNLLKGLVRLPPKE